jgi:predicted ArsR family transcriptional regulator
MNYFPSYSEEEFNQKFRQETKRRIIELLQERPNLTDREIADILGYNDPNKVRPRRNELAKKELVVEDKKRVCLIGHKQSIAWKLNRERLYAYMNS